MKWIEAVAYDMLAEGERQVVHLDGHAVLLIHHDGQIYAVGSACPHMRLPLKGAEVEEHTLTCPWHRSQFDLRSGDVQAWSPWPPAVGRMLGALSREKALPVYPTKVDAGKIWIGLEEEAPDRETA